MIWYGSNVYMTFAEKMNDVRGHLIANIRMDELFLSHMMGKLVISGRQKSDIQHVCTYITNVCTLTLFMCFNVIFGYDRQTFCLSNVLSVKVL